MLLFLAIDSFLKKLGPAFTGIFKILIPAVLFYYPFKMLIFALPIFLMQLGIPNTLSKNSETIYMVLYIIFVILLVLAPKVASAIEFVLMPLYLVSLEYLYSTLFNIRFYSLDFSRNIFDINVNRICVIALVIFIIFKILFFAYLKHNMDKICDLEMDN